MERRERGKGRKGTGFGVQRRFLGVISTVWTWEVVGSHTTTPVLVLDEESALQQFPMVDYKMVGYLVDNCGLWSRKRV